MKHIITILVAFLWTAFIAGAQGFFSQGVSQNQKLVEEALSDAFMIVHVEFQIEDTVSHERFNLEGKDFFGFTEGLCVKTSGGWIAPTPTVIPWINNTDVKKYPEYKPVLSVASVLSPADTVWKPLELKLLSKAESLEGIAYSCVADTSSFGPGLFLGGFDKETEGWIVWVSRKGNKLSTTTYSHRVIPTDSTTFGIGRKVVPDGVVGGFYVKTVYPSVGAIRFDLAGMMAKGPDGWKVVPLNGVEEQAAKPVLASEKPKLVPVGEKKADDEPGAPIKEKKNKKDKKNK